VTTRVSTNIEVAYTIVRY